MECPLLELSADSKSLSRRWFSPVTQGSLRMTVLFLITSATGPGITSMPATLMSSGVSGGIAMLAFAGWTLYQSIVMTGKCYNKYNYNNFAQIINVVGGRGFEFFVLVLMTMSVALTIALPNLIIAEMLGQSFYLAGLIEFDQRNYDRSTDPFCIWTIVILSLMQLKMYANTPSPAAMKRYTLMSIASLAFTILVLFCELPAYIDKFWEWEDFNFWIDFSERTPRDLSVYMFSFTVAGNSVIAVDHLRNPTIRRVKKVSLFTNLGLSAIYVPITLLGYLSTLEHTPEIVVDRQTIPGISTWPMQAARLSLVVCLNTANISSYVSLRASICQLKAWVSYYFDQTFKETEAGRVSETSGAGVEIRSLLDQERAAAGAAGENKSLAERIDESFTQDHFLQDVVTVFALGMLTIFISNIITMVSLVGGFTSIVVLCIPIAAGMKLEGIFWKKHFGLHFLFVSNVIFAIYTVVFDFLVLFGLANELESQPLHSLRFLSHSASSGHPEPLLFFFILERCFSAIWSSVDRNSSPCLIFAPFFDFDRLIKFLNKMTEKQTNSNVTRNFSRTLFNREMEKQFRVQGELPFSSSLRDEFKIDFFLSFFRAGENNREVKRTTTKPNSDRRLSELRKSLGEKPIISKKPH